VAPARYFVVLPGGVVRPADYPRHTFWHLQHYERPFLEGGGRVAKTVLAGGVEVSTMFIGQALPGSPPGGPPLVFETLVLGGPRSGETDRYATEADALSGHERVVALVRGDPKEG
jgi:hypothetical protein